MKFTAKYLFFLIILGPVVLFGLFYAADEVFGLNNLDFLRENIEEQVGETEEDKVDTRPLNITVDNSKKEVLESVMDVLVTSNKEISEVESNRAEIVFTANDHEGDFYYVVQVSNIPVGESTVSFTIKDAVGNSEKIIIPVERSNARLPFGQSYIEPWPESNYIVDGSSLTAFVSRENRLLSTFEPEQMVDLNEGLALITNVSGLLLEVEAAEQLRAMLLAMKSEIGEDIIIASAYRSYNNQVQTYSSWVSALGEEEANKISAKPGYSEHQLGTVVDFINAESGYEFTEAFDSTRAGVWLQENAHQYGFVQSYPKGSEELTGYSYEAWQYRYIGTENAKEVHESGVFLVEWLESKYNLDDRDI